MVYLLGLGCDLGEMSSNHFSHNDLQESSEIFPTTDIIALFGE